MIIHRMEIVNLNISFLVGLETLTKYRMYVDNVRNEQCFPDLKFEFSFVQKDGHIYMELSRNNVVIFTEQELLKLHRGFSNPGHNKLLNLLLFARPAEVDAEPASVLNYRDKHRKRFQYLGPALIRF